MTLMGWATGVPQDEDQTEASPQGGAYQQDLVQCVSGSATRPCATGVPSKRFKTGALKLPSTQVLTARHRLRSTTAQEADTPLTVQSKTCM